MEIRSQKEDQKLTEFEPAGVVARLTHQHLLQVEGGGDAEQIFTFRSDNAKYNTLSQKIKSFLIYSSSSHLDSVSGLLSRLPSILVEKPEKKMILIFTKCAPNLYRERTVVATIRET